MYAYSDPRIAEVEFWGKVYIGLIKSDVRLVFWVKLSDGTVDLLQAKEGTSGCNALLAKIMEEEDPHAEPVPPVEAERTIPDSGAVVEDIEIPIEILLNLYSLSLSNIALKHHKTYINGLKKLDFVTLKCKINYSLNGQREGERKLLFVSYDAKDEVIVIVGGSEAYYLTKAGHEFVEVCFNDYVNNPVNKISVSVKEV